MPLFYSTAQILCCAFSNFIDHSEWSHLYKNQTSENEKVCVFMLLYFYFMAGMNSKDAILASSHTEHSLLVLLYCGFAT